MGRIAGVSFTIHLLTRQPFPAGLRLSATWDDPEDALPGRRGHGVVVGLSSAPVRELSTSKLRAAWGRSRGSGAKSSTGDRWLPQSRVFIDKGSDMAIAVGEALVDALGGVMVLDGWVDEYEEKDSIFYMSENIPVVAPSKDELRAIFKKKVAAARSVAKKAAEARRKKAHEEFLQERQSAATVTTSLTATLERAAAGDAAPPPALVMATDNDRALHEAVRGLLSKGELPVLLGLASRMEYGVQRGLAACLTTTRLLVVPVDVQTSAPSHRFADPLTVKVKPAAKPVYDVSRSDLRALRINAASSDVIDLTPHFVLSMQDTSPHPRDAEQTDPLSNQRAFRTHLASELVCSGAKWTVAAGW